MKKIVMIVLAAAMTLGIARAAEQDGKKEQKTTTTVFATDIDCEHCAKRIMDNVPALGKGIKDVRVDVPTKRVTVVYDRTKNSDAEIVRGLAKLRVKADPVEKE